MTKALALPFLLLTTPALAGSFTPPEGCTTFLTVQSRGCYVANYYRCEADTPGDQWRADFDQQGPFYLSRINSETQWVESYDPTRRCARRLILTLPIRPVSPLCCKPGPIHLISR